MKLRHNHFISVYYKFI